MKTVGELRKLIADNGGELKIGGLTFTYDGKDDIDVSFAGELIMWFGSGNNENDLLTDEGNFSVSSTFKELKDKVKVSQDLNLTLQTLQTEKEELEKTVEGLKHVANDNVLAVGKVAAYEKLLFSNRKLSLE